jgi:hypothetical protein
MSWTPPAVPAASMWACSAPSTASSVSGDSSCRTTCGRSLRASTWWSALSKALSPWPSSPKMRTSFDRCPSDTLAATTMCCVRPSSSRRPAGSAWLIASSCAAAERKGAVHVGALGLQGVHEPGALRGVVVAAVGGDVRRGKALLRVAAFGVGRAFVLPGLGAEFGAAQHLAQGRCRIAHGRDQVAVVGGHVEAVELGGLLQQRPEHLGGLRAVFAGRMQAGRIADGANHRVGLGEECEHVVFHAVVVDLVRGRAHLRHHALDGPVAQCHQQQRLHQRDGADDGADVDTKAAHAGACEIVCHTDPAAPLRALRWRAPSFLFFPRAILLALGRARAGGSGFVRP